MALIQIVDENDQPIRGATKQEAWEQGLLHRLVRVMVQDADGRILLQKRSPTKQPSPNCWDNSAAGHVDLGEDYLTAAKRELKEEIGIADADLQEVGSYRTNTVSDGRKLNRIQRVFKTVIDPATASVQEPDQIAEIRWFTLDQIKKLIHDDPDHMTHGLHYTVEHYY